MDSLQGNLFEGKVCKRCGLWLPFVKFMISKASEGGRCASCYYCYGRRERLDELKRSRQPAIAAKEAAFWAARAHGKVCCRCNQHLPFDEFHINRAKKDGHASACRDCYSHRNTEDLARAKKEKHQANLGLLRCARCHEWKLPECYRLAPARKSGRNKYCEVCYIGIAEIHKEVSRLSYEKSKAEAADLPAWKAARQDRYRQWCSDNPEKSRLRHHIRRARVTQTGGRFTAEEWKQLCDHYGNVCLACGEAKPLTIDHIVPVVKGGTNDISNIQPLCGNCNSQKSRKTIDYRPQWNRLNGDGN